MQQVQRTNNSSVAFPDQINKQANLELPSNEWPPHGEINLRKCDNDL